jgi:hypothetical protein
MISLEEGLVIFNEVLVLYRTRWTFAYYSWEDVSQDIRFHFCKKFHLYDQNRPLKPWCARLIQSQIKNQLRNRYYIYQAPCLKCEYFLGDNQCKKYGEVCKKCPIYKKFVEQKGHAANINFPVSYETVDYDTRQSFSCNAKDLCDTIHDALSGVHKDIFKMHYESGFCTVKIARSVLISGMSFKQKTYFIENSLKNTQEISKGIIEDKKISMGL